MAELVKSVVPFGTVSEALTFTAASGSDYIVDDNADQRVDIIAQNTDTAAATVVLKAGDGLLSSLGDLTVTVPASSSVAIPLARAESARIKNTTGTNAGKILVTETATTLAKLSFAVISVA